MSEQEIIDALRAGVKIRWLPKSVIYNKVRGEDERYLCVGKKLYFRFSEYDKIWDSLDSLVKAKKIRKITRGGIIDYELLE